LGGIFQPQVVPHDNWEKLDAFKQQIQDREEQIMQARRLTTPFAHVLIESIALHYSRMVALTNNTNISMDMNAVEQFLQSVKKFQTILNQAGFNLALEYIGSMLESDSLPHEAFNTIRRAFFRVNFKTMGFTKESQGLLVTYLEEAVEQSPSKLPQSIISVLFSMTRAVEDPTLILKAIGVIGYYKKNASSSDDKANTALDILESRLSQDTTMLPRSPQLDLFSSHMYADAKAVRNSKKVTKSRTSTMSTLV